MFERPPGVHESHGRFYWVNKNQWHPLTRLEEGELALLEAYYELTRNDPRTMAGVLIAYLKEGVPKLGAETQPDYRRIVLTRLIPWCGHMVRNTMKPKHVAQYLARREDEGAPKGGNRERTVLSSAVNFGMRKGWLDENPCHGVRRNKETPNTVYVEHQTLSDGIDKANEPLQDFLAAVYLTGMRQTDIMLMKHEQLTREGIKFTEKKTGKEWTMEWTPTLRYFVNRAAARSRAIGSEFVFTTITGIPWRKWGLQSAMRRLEGGFTVRQLRPKASSDAGHNVLGHGPAMLRVYKRRGRLKPVK